MQKGSDTCIFFSVGTLFKRIFEIVLSKYDQFPIYRLKHQCSYYIRRIDGICRSILLTMFSMLSTLNYIFSDHPVI